MTIQYLRLPAVLSLRQRSRSTHYGDVAGGLATRPVRIGARATATPLHEIEAINAARLSGADDDQIRHLVRELHEARNFGQPQDHRPDMNENPRLWVNPEPVPPWEWRAPACRYHPRKAKPLLVLGQRLGPIFTCIGFFW